MRNDIMDFLKPYLIALLAIVAISFFIGFFTGFEGGCTHNKLITDYNPAFQAGCLLTETRK